MTTIFDQFLHPSLRFLHIAAGLLAIVAGFVALYAAKGAPVHRNIGVFFVYAMLVNAGAGTVLSIVKHDMGDVMGGSYMECHRVRGYVP